MKILFVCENYLPHYGGVEVVFKNLAERFIKNGHTVSLLTHQLEGTKKYEEINGVKVYRVPSFNSRYIFSFASIMKVIKLAKKHDIIQTTTFNGAFPAWLAGKITKKAVIMTVHEIWVGKWDQVTEFSRLKNKIHDLFERAIYLLSFDKYVCVSNATKNDLLKHLPKRKNTEGKVTTIHNGLDYNFWNSKNFSNEKVMEIKEKLNLNNRFIYFSWGRPGTSKGFEYVVKAIPRITKEVPNSIFLLMLGSVDKYKKNFNRIMRSIKELNRDDHVKVISSVPYEKLGLYIKMANCCVIPSIAEGFGYTTAESNAMEKIVVASNAGAIPEVISGKHWLFESKNSDDLANKVIKVAKGEFKETPLKKFEWEPSVEKYLKIYKEEISKK